ncbi:MAG: dihydropteroate synthase [Candidatus Omnitrophota bacterium]
MLVIGELINGMYEQIKAAIIKKDKKVIQAVALRQIECGADALDINVGPASLNQLDDMKWLIEAVQEVTDKAISIDSPKPKVIEEVLPLVKNKVIINSTDAGDEKLDILLPLAKRYNGRIIALAMDKKQGVPRDRNVRSELAVKIISKAMEIGLNMEDVYIDPIVLPVNAVQPQAIEVLESIRELKMLCSPPPKTIVGLSNVSQGSKQRSLINRTFAAMAVAMGLDGAILDPLDKDLMEAVITAELIMNKHIYCDSFVEAYRKK